MLGSWRWDWVVYKTLAWIKLWKNVFGGLSHVVSCGLSVLVPGWVLLCLQCPFAPTDAWWTSEIWVSSLHPLLFASLESSPPLYDNIEPTILPENPIDIVQEHSSWRSVHRFTQHVYTCVRLCVCVGGGVGGCDLSNLSLSRIGGDTRLFSPWSLHPRAWPPSTHHGSSLLRPLPTSTKWW